MNEQQKVYEILNNLNISYEVIYHQAVYTIEEMDKLEIPSDLNIVKNLFLRDDKGRNHYLVLVRKDKTVNLKDLKTKLNSTSLGFASPERLFKYLGVEKGSVTPLGIINDKEHEVVVVFDNDLKGQKKLGVHPNENTATVVLSFEDLIKIIKEYGNKIIFADI
jgi:Ala-tRNA(Pro) deacylase